MAIGRDYIRLDQSKLSIKVLQNHRCSQHLMLTSIYTDAFSHKQQTTNKIYSICFLIKILDFNEIKTELGVLVLVYFSTQ